MKKRGLKVGIGVGFFSLMMILPGMLVGVASGVTIHVPVGVDQWFMGEYQINCQHVADNQDANLMVGAWMGGLCYRDYSVAAPGDDYDFYADEVFFPWIRITYNNGGNDYDVYYPHDDPAAQGGTDDGHLMPYWSSYVGGNTNVNPNGLGSHLDVKYQLDIDSCGNPEYLFEERIYLDGTPGPGVGVITMMWAMTWCAGWAFNGLGNVQKITVPYVCNAKVINPTNRIEENNGGWSQITYEDGPVAVGAGGAACARVTNNDYPGRDIAMVPTVFNQISGDYWCLKTADGNDEISQYPSAYQDNENVVDQHVILWYTQDFGPNNLPQNGVNFFEMVQFIDLEA